MKLFEDYENGILMLIDRYIELKIKKDQDDKEYNQKITFYENKISEQEKEIEELKNKQTLIQPPTTPIQPSTIEQIPTNYPMINEIDFDLMINERSRYIKPKYISYLIDLICSKSQNIHYFITSDTNTNIIYILEGGSWVRKDKNKVLTELFTFYNNFILREARIQKHTTFLEYYNIYITHTPFYEIKQDIYYVLCNICKKNSTYNIIPNKDIFYL